MAKRKMSKQAEKALRESIKTWKHHVAHPANTLLGREGCALCALYWGALEPEGCRACPIQQHTGRIHCYGTPYAAANHALLRIQEGVGYPATFVARAADQVRFLESLLPKGRPYAKKKRKK